MPDQLSVVARRIKEVREAKKLSRQGLADRLGTTYLQVYRIETGARDVSAEEVIEFADALGTSVTSLYREARAS